MRKILKVFGIVLASVLLVVVLISGFAVGRQLITDRKINNDITAFLSNEAYEQEVRVNGVELVKQDISCGYAVIEMFGKWAGTPVTEEDLYNQYGKVVTTTGNAFCKEMNKQFPEYHTMMLKNGTNTELLERIYESLKDGIPVPIEFAALYQEGEEKVWTLHYALVTAMDVPNDTITVANPYGYIENYTIDDFLKATRFESYKNMPVYLKFAFAFGIFEKNTVYIPQLNKKEEME